MPAEHRSDLQLAVRPVQLDGALATRLKRNTTVAPSLGSERSVLTANAKPHCARMELLRTEADTVALPGDKVQRGKLRNQGTRGAENPRHRGPARAEGEVTPCG